MARKSRRDELLAAALVAFQEKGYEGASVADVVLRLGMSKAAFGYHVESKEQLLIELVEPLLEDLEAALDRFPRHPSWPGQGRALISDYLDVLLEHRDLVIWIDGDKAVLLHPLLGKRLSESNRRVRQAIRGDDRSSAARLGASAALGALWRPLRNLPEVAADDEKEAMIAVAMAVVSTVREPARPEPDGPHPN
jgi:AcrR family transcriptional regulator